MLRVFVTRGLLYRSVVIGAALCEAFALLARYLPHVAIVVGTIAASC